jgi:hypothetical protein
MARFGRFELRTLRSWVRGIGLAIALLGLGALPLGVGVSPMRDTNLFNNLADTGMFIKYGLLLILLGIVILVGSVFIPPYDDDGT